MDQPRTLYVKSKQQVSSQMMKTADLIYIFAPLPATMKVSWNTLGIAWNLTLTLLRLSKNIKDCHQI